MKKALVVVAAVVAAIVLAAWVISWFWAEDAVASSAAQPWPGGMGTLDALDRLPPQQANDASLKLTGLANALPKNEIVADFVEREIARGELTIGEPPVLGYRGFYERLERAPLDLLPFVDVNRPSREVGADGHRTTQATLR